MNQSYNLVEFFSGIGSQARALENLNIKINTLATCEWDIHAFVAYDAIHNTPELPAEIRKMDKEELLMELSKYTLSNDGKNPMEYSILRSFSVDSLRRIYAGIIRSNNCVDIRNVNGKTLPKHIDILTYSFPCQDLSNVGAFHGYNLGIDKDSGSRSSLLWEVGRIISEMRQSRIRPPRFLLMENVPALLSERHRANFKMWRDELSELGYESYYYQLNACSFGLPQNRPRLLMISAYVGKNKALRNKVKRFLQKKSKDVIDDYQKSEYYHDIKPGTLYRIDYENPVLREEAEAVVGLNGAEQEWRAGNGPAVAHSAGLGFRKRNPRPAGQGVANGADLLRQGFGMRLQRLEADRFGQAEGVAVLPDQFGQHRAALQSRPQAVGEGPNVGAGAARDPE